ncbi:MAG: GxxExxY protein [Candidatus Nitrospinota bacterium M3_3B_026]
MTKRPGWTEKDLNAVSGEIVDAAMKVHSALGRWRTENAYEACLEHELRKRGLRVRRQVPVPVVYDGARIDAGMRVDLVVEREIAVELKAAAKLSRRHEAQLLSYLRAGRWKIGLLINFGATHLRDGIRRMVNRL